MKFTDLIELESSVMVCAEIDGEELEGIFKELGRTPRNCVLAEDDSFVVGEIQYIFEPDMSGIQEVLVYPVYADESGFINGDFVAAPDRYWSKELVEEARKAAALGDFER